MRKLLALLLALTCLVGCTPAEPGSEQTEGEFGLWYALSEIGAGENYSDVIGFEPRPWDELPTVQTLLDTLLAGPESAELVSPFPAGVKVQDLRLDVETATLHINLSEQYGSLSGFDLTLADYCIVKTMCQIPWVKSVRILVDGETIPYRSRQNLQDSDTLLSGIGEEPDSFLAALYFPDRDNLGLVAEYRRVERSGSSSTEIIMTELLRGPIGVEANAALPDGTQILGLSVSGNTCQVDLSAEFIDNAPQNGMGPTLTLYSLVNTLCTLSGIMQVRLLVEGTVLQEYHGVSVSTPISANFDLTKDK